MQTWSLEVRPLSCNALLLRVNEMSGRNNYVVIRFHDGREMVIGWTFTKLSYKSNPKAKQLPQPFIEPIISIKGLQITSVFLGIALLEYLFDLLGMTLNMFKGLPWKKPQYCKPCQKSLTFPFQHHPYHLKIGHSHNAMSKIAELNWSFFIYIG